MTNCGNCKTNPNCEKDKLCMCHSVPVYASSPHVIHRPVQLSEGNDRFKAAQIAHLKRRFPELNEEQVQKMYNDNLYV